MNTATTTGRPGPSAFLAWWFEELAGLLPEGVRRAFRRPTRIVVLDLAGPEVVMARYIGARARVIGRIDPRQAGATAMRRFGARLARACRRADAVMLRLPDEKALRRRIEMPLVPDADLRRALFFEIDRQTPFQRDHVFFDQAVVGRKEEEKRLVVDLWIVPRQVIEQALSPFSDGATRPAFAEIIGEAGDVVARLDLRDPADRRRAGRLWRLLNRGLVLLALGLMGVALHLPLDARRQLDESLAVDVAKSRARAEATMATRRELDRLSEIDRRLRLRKLQAPRVVVLDELTRRLPDETWLASLQIDGHDVRLTGYAPVAASLIGLLDASEYFGTPSSQSPVTQDARSGKERFTLAFELESREVAP